jgi:hypothetical protein
MFSMSRSTKKNSTVDNVRQLCEELNLEHFDEKRAITPKWVLGFTSKLQSR